MIAADMTEAPGGAVLFNQMNTDRSEMAATASTRTTRRSRRHLYCGQQPERPAERSTSEPPRQRQGKLVHRGRRGGQARPEDVDHRARPARKQVDMRSAAFHEAPRPTASTRRSSPLSKENGYGVAWMSGRRAPPGRNAPWLRRERALTRHVPRLRRHLRTRRRAAWRRTSLARAGRRRLRPGGTGARGRRRSSNSPRASRSNADGRRRWATASACARSALSAAGSAAARRRRQARARGGGGLEWPRGDRRACRQRRHGHREAGDRQGRAATKSQ